MRLLNLELDNVYLRGGFKRVALPNGNVITPFALNLGSPIYVNLNNEIYLYGRDNPIELSCQSQLEKGTFGLKKVGIPLICDEGDKNDIGYNLLFTGVYAPDCKSLVSEISLNCSKQTSTKIKVIAGGYMPLMDGTPYVNLVLLVPDVCNFIIGKQSFSCRGGKPVKASGGALHLGLQEIVKQAITSGSLDVYRC